MTSAINLVFSPQNDFRYILPDLDLLFLSALPLICYSIFLLRFYSLCLKLKEDAMTLSQLYLYLFWNEVCYSMFVTSYKLTQMI